MDEKIFGYSVPLRASSIYDLLICEVKEYLMFNSIGSNDVGEAAQTGTVVHAMIEADLKGQPQPNYDELQEKNPKANMIKATEIYHSWKEQWQQSRDKFLESEKTFEVQIKCEGYPIRLQGTIDVMVQRADSSLAIIDFKTGKKNYKSYYYQLAVYVALARMHGHDVSTGMLYFINPEFKGERLKQYHYDEVELVNLIELIRRAVLKVRSGHELTSPLTDSDCYFCPFYQNFQRECGELYVRIKNSN